MLLLGMGLSLARKGILDLSYGGAMVAVLAGRSSPWNNLARVLMFADRLVGMRAL